MKVSDSWFCQRQKSINMWKGNLEKLFYLQEMIYLRKGNGFVWEDILISYLGKKGEAWRHECWPEGSNNRKSSRAFYNTGRLSLCSEREGERPDWGRVRKKASVQWWEKQELKAEAVLGETTRNRPSGRLAKDILNQRMFHIQFVGFVHL